jgi:hypothetical protein
VDTISNHYINQIKVLESQLSVLKEQFETLKDFTFTGQAVSGVGYAGPQGGDGGGGDGGGGGRAGQAPINIDFSNMFAGQFAGGPVNVNGNQQVQGGTGMTGGDQGGAGMTGQLGGSAATPNAIGQAPAPKGLEAGVLPTNPLLPKGQTIN